MLAETGLVAPVQGTLMHRHYSKIIKCVKILECWVKSVEGTVLLNFKVRHGPIASGIITIIVPTLGLRGSAGHSIGTQASFGPEKLSKERPR